MDTKKWIGVLLFIGVLSVSLLLNPPSTLADCISDWLLANPAQGPISTQESSDVKCIFDWFETTFPAVFPPTSNTINNGPLAYRSYTGSGALLAAWKTTSLKIAYLGPLSKNCIMDLGTVDFWKSMVCQSSTSITPGLWTGSNIQFYVSSDSTKLTSTGSSILYNTKTYSLALGPTTYTNVGSCGDIELTLYLPSDIPITNNAFSIQTTGGSVTILGKFNSNKSSSGTYSLNYSIPECFGNAIGSGAWSATSSSVMPFLTESDGQSNRHEIATDDMVMVITKP